MSEGLFDQIVLALSRQLHPSLSRGDLERIALHVHESILPTIGKMQGEAERSAFEAGVEKGRRG